MGVLNGAITVLAQPSTAQPEGTSGPLDCPVSAVAVDVNLTALTGGTAPTVQYFLDRLGADGLWYNLWAPPALSAPGGVDTSVGPGMPTAAVLTGQLRLRWVFGGTVAPTSVTFSASIVGR